MRPGCPRITRVYSPPPPPTPRPTPCRFVHMKRDMIKKMHIVDLQSSYSCHGLTMDELRGVYAVLATFTFSEPKKEEWRKDVRSKLKELTERRKRAASQQSQKKKAAAGGGRSRRHTIGATADNEQKCSASMRSKQAALQAGLMGSLKKRLKGPGSDPRASFKMSLQSALNAKLGIKGGASESKGVEERKRGDGKDDIRAKLSLMLGGGARGGRRGSGGRGGPGGRGGRGASLKKKNDGKDDIRAKLSLMLGGGQGRGGGRGRGHGHGRGRGRGRGRGGLTSSSRSKPVDPEKEAFKRKLNTLLGGGAPRGVIRKTSKSGADALGIKQDPAKKAEIRAKLEGVLGKRSGPSARLKSSAVGGSGEEKAFSPRPPAFTVRRRVSLSPHLLAKFGGGGGGDGGGGGAKGSRPNLPTTQPRTKTPRRKMAILEQKVKEKDKGEVKVESVVSTPVAASGEEKKTPNPSTSQSSPNVVALSPREQELILKLREKAAVQADAKPEVLSPAEHAVVLKLRSEGALIDVEDVNEVVKRVASGAKAEAGKATTEVLSPSEKSVVMKLREEGVLDGGVSSIEEILERVALESRNGEDKVDATAGNGAMAATAATANGTAKVITTTTTTAPKDQVSQEQKGNKVSTKLRLVGVAVVVALVLALLLFFVLQGMGKTSHVPNPTMLYIPREKNTRRGQSWNKRRATYRRRNARGRLVSVEVFPDFKGLDKQFTFTSMQDAFVVVSCTMRQLASASVALTDTTRHDSRFVSETHLWTSTTSALSLERISPRSTSRTISHSASSSSHRRACHAGRVTAP